MSLSLAQREEIAALLRERRQNQDMAHSQLASYSGMTPAQVRKILRGEPHTLVEYQLLATPLGVPTSELESILGGRDAMQAARVVTVAKTPAPAPKLASKPKPRQKRIEVEPAPVPAPVSTPEPASNPITAAGELDRAHLAKRIISAMKRHDVDARRVAQLTELPLVRVHRVLKAQETGLTAYNRIFRLLLEPTLPTVQAPAAIPSSTSRTMAPQSGLSSRDRKRHANDLRARIKASPWTHAQVAQHIERPVSWLKDLLRAKMARKEAYDSVFEALEDMKDLDNSLEVDFPTLAQRLVDNLGGRTRSSVARELGRSPASLAYVLSGRAKSAEAYLEVGLLLGLPSDWTDLDWEPTPVEEERTAEPVKEPVQEVIPEAPVQVTATSAPATSPTSSTEFPVAQFDAITNALSQTLESLTSALSGWTPADTQSTNIVSALRDSSGQLLGVRSDGVVLVVGEDEVFVAQDFRFPVSNIPASWPERDVSWGKQS